MLTVLFLSLLSPMFRNLIRGYSRFAVYRIPSEESVIPEGRLVKEKSCYLITYTNDVAYPEELPLSQCGALHVPSVK
jgi:hypothetical protein